MDSDDPPRPVWQHGMYVCLLVVSAVVFITSFDIFAYVIDTRFYVVGAILIIALMLCAVAAFLVSLCFLVVSATVAVWWFLGPSIEVDKTRFEQLAGWDDSTVLKPEVQEWLDEMGFKMHLAKLELYNKDSHVLLFHRWNDLLLFKMRWFG